MGRVEVRGVELEYVVAGDGPDLVWGHGLTSGMASEDELPLVDFDRLRTVTRVLRYDARGHGSSGSSEELAGYDWRELAHDQLALADEVGIERYVAAGASMGAATAIHAALIAPQRISALVLVIPPTAWETRALQQDTYAASAHLVETGQQETLIANAAALPPPDPFVGRPEWKERSARTFRTTPPERLARVLRGAAGTDLPSPDEIRAISVPTLVLAWSGDAGHPVATAERLVELIDGAELSIASSAAELATWTERIVGFLAAG